jgi:integrase
MTAKPAEPAAPVEPASLYEAHQIHIEALRHQRRSPSTLKAYGIYCGGFVAFLKTRGFEHPMLMHLTPARVAAYQDHSRGTRDGALPNVRRSVRLKTWSTWLWRREYYATDPLARLDPPRVAKIHRVPFSKTDCLRLLEAAQLGPDPIMERALLLLSLDTGARIGELVALDLDDLDLTAGTVLFRGTKNGRPRRVFSASLGARTVGHAPLRSWSGWRPGRSAPPTRSPRCSSTVMAPHQHRQSAPHVPRPG